MTDKYFVPAQSRWPIVGAIGLGLMAIGGANLLHNKPFAHYIFMAGSLIIAYMMFGWFRDVIVESLSNLYSKQMDRSFRWGMVWFIFSEVMFFAAFFGVLFYARQLSVPWLGGIGEHGAETHALLWPDFTAAWPLLNNPNPELFNNPHEAMGPWGLPAINTLILLTSGVTLTYAHWGVQKHDKTRLLIGLFLTVVLGVIFLFLQAYEYTHAYQELHLTLSSGIYGSTFFMLTGFHGAHVTIGTIMLFIMFLRSNRDHFTLNSRGHFAFEATAWYWHFVDAVWLILFVFVYWL